jgi:serine/threonine-protein kinase
MAVTVEVDGIAAVGDVLAGKYRVDKILGIGGMGMVVAATHLELDQRVALKFMLPSSQESQETSGRFLREARAAGRLNSDHVCRVTDVGRFEGGTPYIVMEYLQGESLGALLRRRGPLRVHDAVDYVLQAIEGIAEAHANGIVHRDLKPDNLFLHKRNDGGWIVKVLDFGISKAKAAEFSTRTGDVFGSPAYMAPEQMESSRSVDHRADIWSLGVVLYQLVVGKAPFQGESLPLLCMHVVNDEPQPMSEIRGDLPYGFEPVVMRCLCKDAEARYADVAELAEALAPFGPKDATTSASRIQIVLRRQRTESASVISNEFSTVVPEPERRSREDPDPEREREPREPPRALTAPTRREGAGKPGNTTLGATSGQMMTPASEPHARRLVAGLSAGIVAVLLAIVFVVRSGSHGNAASDEPGIRPAAVPAAVQPAQPPAPPPAPIVEPIEPSAEPAAIPDEPGAPVVAAPAPAPAKPAVKKRRPARPAAPPSRDRAATPAAAGAGSGSGAGSAAPDDDKWMHMTHDDKKP